MTVESNCVVEMCIRDREITKSIQTTGNLDDETAQKLHDAIVEFKKPFNLVK